MSPGTHCNTDDDHQHNDSQHYAEYHVHELVLCRLLDNQWGRGTSCVARWDCVVGSRPHAKTKFGQIKVDVATSICVFTVYKQNNDKLVCLSRPL